MNSRKLKAISLTRIARTLKSSRFGNKEIYSKDEAKDRER